MRIKTKLSRLAAGLLTVLLLAAVVLPAGAAEWIDLDAAGSITVTMKNKTKNQPVAGGELTLYQVAAVTEEDGSLSYTYTNGFETCGIDLGNLEDSALAGKLQAKLTDSTVKTTKQIGTDGTVTFTDLPLGLYLLVQNKAAAGYNAISSFLVSVPIQEDGAYVYDVDATPKVELYKETPTTPNTPSSPSTPKLPQTGQLDWPIPVLSFLGVLLFAIGWSMRKKSTK